MLRTARRVNRPEIMLEALPLHAGSLMHAGDGPAFRRLVDEHLRFANRVRHPVHLYFAETFKASRSYMEGALAEAETHARAALRIGQPILETLATVTFAVQLAMLAIDHTKETVCKLLREIRSIIDPVLAQVPFTAWEALKGRLALAIDERDEARSALERLTHDDVRAIVRDKNYPGTLGQLAIIAVELDDRVRSRQLYDALMPFAGEHLATAVFPSAYLGPAAFYLALLAAHIGEHALGQDLFERAERACVAVDTRTYLAWTRLHRARALLSMDGSPQNVCRARAFVDAAERTAMRYQLPGLGAAVARMKCDFTP
jgi:hypothetical protein